MIRKSALTGAAMFVASCGTPEFRAEKDICTARWMSEIPPRYEQELYTDYRSRQVPTGRSTCTKTGNTVTCVDDMRTEYYEVPAVRTVDRNAPVRDAQIAACTQSRCIEQYGNAECKT